MPGKIKVRGGFSFLKKKNLPQAWQQPNCLVNWTMRLVKFMNWQSSFSRGDLGENPITSLRAGFLRMPAQERFFGEIAMLDGKARIADATSVSETKVMPLGQACPIPVWVEPAGYCQRR